MLEVCYLPGKDNSLADVLSREERGYRERQNELTGGEPPDTSTKRKKTRAQSSRSLLSRVELDSRKESCKFIRDIVSQI